MTVMNPGSIGNPDETPIVQLSPEMDLLAELGRLRALLVGTRRELADRDAETQNLRAERDELAGMVRRVEGLFDDSDDPYVHTHPEGEGEPDCAGCWTTDIRNALEDAK
jgi:hypothetical protein